MTLITRVLMNSFNTDEDTAKVLRKYANVQVDVQTFCQSRYPRIDKETLMPIVKDLKDADIEVYCKILLINGANDRPLSFTAGILLGMEIFTRRLAIRAFWTSSLKKERNSASSLTLITWEPRLI